jgi:hypothetical protein
MHVRLTACRQRITLQTATPAEVFIQTAARNALQYLIEPALGIQQRSLREQ